MFGCAKAEYKLKRKSSGWHARASCLRGNDSFDQSRDMSCYALTSDPCTPAKRLRPSTSGGSTPFGLQFIPETESLDFGAPSVDLTNYYSATDDEGEDNKENVCSYQSQFQTPPSSRSHAIYAKNKNSVFLADYDSPFQSYSPGLRKTPSSAKPAAKLTSEAAAVEDKTEDSLRKRLDESFDSVYDSVATGDSTSLLPTVARHSSTDSGMDSMTQKPKKSSSSSKLHKSDSDAKLKKIQDLPKIELTITKGSGGFGFTIKGTTAVRVGKVKAGGAADLQGLRQGDFILTVNGRDSTGETVESIANIVRNSTTEISLTIARSQKHSGSDSEECKQIFCPKNKPAERPTLENQPTAQNSTQEEEKSTKTIISSETTPSQETSVVEKLANWGHDLSKQLLTDINNSFPWQPELSVIREENSVRGTPATICYKRWEPDMSSILSPEVKKAPLTASTTSESDYANALPVKQVVATAQQQLQTRREDLAKDFDAFRPRSLSWSSAYSASSSSSSASLPSLSPDSFTDTETTRSVTSSTGSVRSLGDSGTSDLAPGGHEDSAEATGRPAAVHQLLTSEQDFCRLMKRGIQRFSRPLRHHVMSPTQHQVLFQNLEKLVALSEYHIREMTGSCFRPEDSYLANTDVLMADRVGQIYKPKIGVLSEAYKLYSEGLARSLVLLEKLRCDNHFAKFTKKLERLRGFDLSLSEFLQHPCCHMDHIRSGLSRVLATTSRGHPDHSFIKYVTRALREHRNKTDTVSHSAARMQMSRVTSSQSADRASFSMTTSHVTSMSLSRTVSVDAELIDLQQRLDFGQHVKVFPLVIPHRHVIFSGEIAFMVDDTPAPLWGILCSDILLLTQKEAQCRFKIINDPLPLSHVIELNFDCVDEREFRVLVQNKMTSFSNIRQGALTTSGITEYTFQVPRAEQKWAWKTLMEQKVQASRSQTDSAYCSIDDLS